MKRMHMFSLCFMQNSGFPMTAVVGVTHKCVTAPDILLAQEKMGLPVGCPLIAASYLGHMTPEEFETGELGE